ncbi:MAG: hypothetical protein ABI972_03565 [Acidobacteriota bacterium]
MEKPTGMPHLLWKARDEVVGAAVVGILVTAIEPVMAWYGQRPPSLWGAVSLFVVSAFAVFLYARARPMAAPVVASDGVPTEPDRLEILWRPGEANYHMYYGTNEMALHYRICVINRNRIKKALNVQVQLEDIEPLELPCVPCFLILMNDIRKDNDPRPYKDSFDLKALHSQFVDVLAQDPAWEQKKFWIHHVVKEVERLIPIQQYSFTISATSDNLAGDRRRYTLFKNGPYWQMREVPLNA